MGTFIGLRPISAFPGEFIILSFMAIVLGMGVVLHTAVGRGVSVSVTVMDLSVPVTVMNLSVPVTIMDLSVPVTVMNLSVPVTVMDLSVPVTVMDLSVPVTVMGLSVPVTVMNLSVPVTVMGMGVCMVVSVAMMTMTPVVGMGMAMIVESMHVHVLRPMQPPWPKRLLRPIRPARSVRSTRIDSLGAFVLLPPLHTVHLLPKFDALREYLGLEPQDLHPLRLDSIIHRSALRRAPPRAGHSRSGGPEVA